MSTYCYLSETESEREGKTLALESSLPSPTSCNLCSHGEYQSSEGYDPTYCIILTHSFTFTLGFVNSNTNLTSFLSSFSQNLIFRFLQSVSFHLLIIVDNSFCISPNFSLFFVLTLFSFSNCHLCRKRAFRFGFLSRRI